jgi:hypothetical protein
MLMFKERRAAIRTLRGWAISVLNEAGAIRECGEHGWMLDRADPHARDRAFDIARRNPPPGVSAAEAAVRGRRSSRVRRRYLSGMRIRRGRVNPRRLAFRRSV